MRLKAKQAVSVSAQDRAALQAFHVCPHAHVVVVLRNGSPVFLDSVADVGRAVPEQWQAGLKVYTPSYVLGDGSWWKWIKHMYGGKVPWRSKPTEEEE